MPFQRALLDYFDRQRRDLPWRQDADPYRIWISEVMLQQTRVETVRSYYERWVRQFPDLPSLARAPVDDVLKAWEGLGYYSRARNLHRAANVVCERYQGSLPGTLEELHALPGVGDYTAGAIASIAYRIPAPAVDGNVKRVLARLLDAPRLSARELHGHAARLVPQERPGDFNQAFMELGATICTPRAPRCARCPVADHCLARARGTQLLRPARKVSKPVPDRRFVVLVILDDAQRVLVRQRPQRGLLGGLWEFPTFEDDKSTSHLRRLLGKTPPKPQSLGTVVHAFSHFRAHYVVHLCTVRQLPDHNTDFEIKRYTELEELAVPAAQQKILRLLEDWIVSRA